MDHLSHYGDEHTIPKEAAYLPDVISQENEMVLFQLIVLPSAASLTFLFLFWIAILR